MLHLHSVRAACMLLTISLFAGSELQLITMLLGETALHVIGRFMDARKTARSQTEGQECM
jgi:hypothetical protein